MNCKILNRIIIMCVVLAFSGCKKFLEVGAPLTSINSENVYTTDATAISAVTGIYAQMSNRGVNDFLGIGIYGGLSADELRNYAADANVVRVATYKNSLNSNTGNQNFWLNLYPYVYYANAAIEGLTNNTKVSTKVQQQLLGEAYFVRAFAYFYLTAIYGDVPLVLTTDYTISSTLPRTAKSSVYDQMIADLAKAKTLLSENYVDGTLLSTTTERLRPTKAAASALLSRVYLYKSDYVNAELEATAVIGNANYSLITLANTFLKNSKETIWALQPVGAPTSTAQNSADGGFYIPTGTSTFGSAFPVYLNDNFINSFEAGDNRKTTWIATKGTFNYPYKYKVGKVNTPTAEYSIVLRLAEMYLIRAEARAWQNNISGAQNDLNAIRNRAGLGNTLATIQSSLLTAIAQERKIELFSEWGDRWFNMQRTNTIESIMPAVTAAKGGTWNSYQKLYPIPLVQIQRNPALIQNPGYN